MSNTYQKNRRRAQPGPLPDEIAVPDQVIVAMAEIAGAAKEGLLALAVSTGLQVMTAMFDEDVTRLCGPDGKHNPGRAGYRHGTEAGSVTLGGRRIPVTRPRVRGLALERLRSSKKELRLRLCEQVRNLVPLAEPHSTFLLTSPVDDSYVADVAPRRGVAQPDRNDSVCRGIELSIEVRKREFAVGEISPLD